MIKNIFLYLVVLFFVSCGSNKPIVRTSKAPTRTKPVVQSPPKASQKPVVISPKNEDKKENDYTKTNNSQTEILEATSKVKVTTELVMAYIDTYKEVAKENMKNHGVPASIALAQAILESGAGTGNLSRQANNHFGIKCHKDWQGLSVKHDDDEAQECFRKYETVLDSYHDYAAFLKGRRWYEPLFKLEKNDYKGWAKGLKSAGYATDPGYPTKLIGLIERYQLQKYDAEVLGIEFVPNNSVSFDKNNQVSSSTEGLHEVVKGDTLYSISKRYNITIDDLKKKNNISDNSIAIGQKLQIK